MHTTVANDKLPVCVYTHVCTYVCDVLGTATLPAPVRPLFTRSQLTINANALVSDPIFAPKQRPSHTRHFTGVGHKPIDVAAAAGGPSSPLGQAVFAHPPPAVHAGRAAGRAATVRGGQTRRAGPPRPPLCAAINRNGDEAVLRRPQRQLFASTTEV
jgi:hypothetical protein